MTYVVDSDCFACDDGCCLVGFDHDLSDQSRRGAYARPMFQVLDAAGDYWTDAVRWPVPEGYMLAPVIVNGKELE